MAGSKLLISWLNDAYSMEQSKENMLERFAKDYDDLPDIKSRLEGFKEDAKQHAEDIQACVESLDASTSKTKSILGNLIGAVEGVSTSMYRDEVVKTCL